MIRIIVRLVCIGAVLFGCSVWLWASITKAGRTPLFWMLCRVAAVNIFLGFITTVVGLLETRIAVNGHYEYNLRFLWLVVGIPALVGLAAGNLVGFLFYVRRARGKSHPSV